MLLGLFFFLMIFLSFFKRPSYIEIDDSTIT